MNWLPVRKSERRDASAAFSTLFVLVASHSLLETARDALFLGRVPATRLPWVYLGIALLSLLVLRLSGWAGRRLPARRALSGFTLLAGAGTSAFFWAIPALGTFGLYALYCWSGLLSTLLLATFWTLLGGVFSITQAKRLYGMIGAGSVLGAIVGSGLASVLSHWVLPERLLLLAGAGFAIAAIVPRWLEGEPATEAPEPRAGRLSESLASVLSEPYGFRVVLALLLASTCLTFADFVFKSWVAALVPEARLGAFLGTVYFAVNVLSLGCQLGVVSWLLRRASLGSALAILPALLIGAGCATLVTGGLAAALSIKLVDGSLRYSLHRTAAELLFLPFSDGARRRVKAFVDVVAQRGGQVLSSLFILLFSALSASPRVTAFALVISAGAWVATAISLRRPYIELFRARLQSGRIAHLDAFPELDMASLERLIAALDSENDQEVLAALKILEREKRTRFIPALILHHPSEQVVLRALSILTHSGRRSLSRVLSRVVEHGSPKVRAASIAALSVLSPELARLGERLERESSPEVRAAIVVNLIAAGEFSPAERAARVSELVTSGSVATRLALVEAVRVRKASGFADTLLLLAGERDGELRRAALTALCELVPPSDVQGSKPLHAALISALIDESVRPLAEQLLAARGETAFYELRARFEAFDTDARVRWRLPRAMGELDAALAVKALVAWLPREKDGSVRFQVIRELERLLRRNPSLPFDRRALHEVIEDTVQRAFRSLDRRLALLQGVAVEPRRNTPGHLLLVALLRDKEKNAKGRLFRLLGVQHPREDFAQIQRGLAGSREQRAASLELIEDALREPLRSAVLALVDDGADEDRLARGEHYHRPVGAEYEALLVLLSDSGSEAVREVARFHAAELDPNEAPKQGGQAA